MFMSEKSDRPSCSSDKPVAGMLFCSLSLAWGEVVGLTVPAERVSSLLLLLLLLMPCDVLTETVGHPSGVFL